MKRAVLCFALAACGGSSSSPDATPAPDASEQVVEGPCVVDAANAPDDLRTVVCEADFEAMAAAPFDNALPGARSAKVVLDQADGNALYIQNTNEYEIHYAFVSSHLSGNGLPIVGDLGTFNSTEYFSPDRRFVLGAVTYYAQPDRWVLELSPYDTASAAMIEALFTKVKLATYFGPRLAFHPTSSALTAVAATLPASVPVVTTDDLYAGISYQPLALGEAVGRLHFTTAASLAAGEYLSYQDIVVLDEVPNDISVVQGVITQEFQTPLSHVNVLSHNRHTPNMGLRDAQTDATLVALKDKLVKLDVQAEGWTAVEVSQAEAEAYWAAHAPTPVTLPTLDLTETTIRDIATVTPDPAAGTTLRQAISASVTRYGGKAAHYAVLYNTPNMPIRKAFAVPVSYYHQFMTENGFDTRVAAMLADPSFTSDPAVRDAQLAQLRADMVAAPVNAGFTTALSAKIASGWSSYNKVRFRSSSNSEDLAAFPCAGCYDSYSGKVGDLNDTLTAVKKVYASVWTFRAFELRSYYGVAHDSVGMALLVHESFPDEEANGVAVTANPFVQGALDPAFYINVQKGGDVEVVSPPPGVSSDQFVYYFQQPNQPIAYIAHSNLIDAGATVLTTSQVHELGVALDLIHTRFSAAYGPAAGNTGWYAMDVEFKFDDDENPGQPAKCYIKQARFYSDPRGTN